MLTIYKVYSQYFFMHTNLNHMDHIVLHFKFQTNVALYFPVLLNVFGFFYMIHSVG